MSRYCLWKDIEPSISSFNTSLTVAELRANPQLVADWSAKVSWKACDNVVQLATGQGLQPIIEVLRTR